MTLSKFRLGDRPLGNIRGSDWMSSFRSMCGYFVFNSYQSHANLRRGYELQRYDSVWVWVEVPNFELVLREYATRHARALIATYGHINQFAIDSVRTELYTGRMGALCITVLKFMRKPECRTSAVEADEQCDPLVHRIQYGCDEVVKTKGVWAQLCTRLSDPRPNIQEFIKDSRWEF